MDGNPDMHARTLARLDPRQPVRLAVGGETITGVAAAAYRGDECIRVDVAERDGDRTFRVLAHWVEGWREPTVDVRASGDTGFRPADRFEGLAVGGRSRPAGDDPAATAE